MRNKVDPELLTVINFLRDANKFQRFAFSRRLFMILLHGDSDRRATPADFWDLVVCPAWHCYGLLVVAFVAAVLVLATAVRIGAGF